MYIERTVLAIKPGTDEELFGLVKHYLQDEENAFKLKRVMSPTVAPPYHMALEWEWESLAAMEKGWSEWREDPDTAEFYSKWLALINGGVSNEVWEVME